MLLWARLLAEMDAIPNPMMEGVGTVTNVATEILAQTEARLLAPPRSSASTLQDIPSWQRRWREAQGARRGMKVHCGPSQLLVWGHL